MTSTLARLRNPIRVPLTERLDLIADYRWFYPIGDVPGDTWDRSWRQSMAFGGLQLRF